MKLSALLLAGILALVAVAAPSAKADGVNDPNVTIGKGFGSIGTTAGGSDLNPIVIPDLTTLTFCYGDEIGGVCTPDSSLPALSAIYIEILPNANESNSFFQSEGFTCTNGAGSTACEETSPCYTFMEGAASDCAQVPEPAVEFVFLATDSQGNPVPFITSGEDITVAITPEPTSVLLLAIGLVAVAFGLKRRQQAPVL